MKLIAMSYVIQGNPLGLSAPSSAFEALHGIAVTARKVKSNIIVAKTEIVAKLREKQSIFTDFWNATNVESIEFEEKNCREQKH